MTKIQKGNYCSSNIDTQSHPNSKIVGDATIFNQEIAFGFEKDFSFS